jgi:hypothetical protein
VHRQGGRRILGEQGSHRSYAALEDPFHITVSVKNGSDLQWFRLGPIDDQIRVDGEKFHIFVGKVLPTVTGTGGSREKGYFLADGGFNAVRNCEAGLFFDVTPDFDEIERSLRRKNKAHAHLGLAFQIRQVSIQLIFRDSFAAVELLDAAPNLCVDCFPVLQEPTILFFLGLQQTEQDFLDAARAGCLKLFLDSGLKGRIVDFDVHGCTLQKGIGASPYRI